MVAEQPAVALAPLAPPPDDVEFQANAGIYLVTFKGPYNPPVRFRFDRFYESGHKSHCECTVLSRDPERSGEIASDDIMLVSTITQKRLAKAIEESWVGYDWLTLVKRAVKLVREHYRQGEPTKDLLASEPPEEALPWQVFPLVLQGFPTVFYGPPGVGKGFLACLLSLSIAEGLSECGLSVLPGNVLYLDYEASDRDIQQRLWAIHRGLFNGPATGRVVYRPCYRTVMQDAPELQRIVVENNISAIVVDSAAPASGEPQNDDAVTATYSSLRSMRPTDTAPPATPIIIAHQAKNATEKTPFGSVMWTARARDTFWINGAENGSALTVSLQHIKANNRRKLAPLAYRFQFDGKEIKVTKALAADVPELEAQLPLWRRLRNILSRGGLSLDQMARDTLTPGANVATHTQMCRNELSRHPEVFVKLSDTRGEQTWGLVTQTVK